jgi:gamma-butyrobetaine dioxygenase
VDVTDEPQAQYPPQVLVTVQELIDACRSMAGLPYDGEPVDQLQHALQCGHIARSDGADPEFVVACLLHDVARAPMVADMPYDGPREHHGEAGSRWLTPRVGSRVAWLVEQHVPAKRYLVATDGRYAASLSDVSIRTLAAQGGPMDEAEVAEFREHRDWQLAVALRLIDDRGKVVGWEVPAIDSYRGELTAVVAATRRASGV